MSSNTIVTVIIGLVISGMLVMNFNQEETIQMLLQNLPTSDLSQELSEANLENQFGLFIATFRRSYDNVDQYQERYQVFKDNYKYIAEHNANKGDALGFWLGINDFADLTNQEYRDTYLGLKGGVPEDAEFMQSGQGLQIPSSIDWRERNKVSPVKNQGACGSCWSFSAISVIESAYLQRDGAVEQLSEQQMVDCVKEPRWYSNGCYGGIMHHVFEYAKEKSICLMKDMPYQTKQLTCRDSECNTKYYVKGHTFVKSYSRDALYTAIAQQPVAGALEASSREFQLYKSGILNSGCTTEINHAVTLVGFSYNRYMWFWKNHYILVKNSWGSSWGDNGFIKIGSNSLEGKGMCGIYQYNVFPKV